MICCPGCWGHRSVVGDPSGRTKEREGVIAVHCVQVGGATGVVGDPSGHTKEREGISSDSLERNKEALKENLHRIFLNGQDGEALSARQHLK